MTHFLRRRRSLPGRTSAFTLIELLTVVALIAVLAVLIASASGLVRDQAGRAVAASNLRAIGSALHQYAGDHAGLLPGPMWPGQIPVRDPNREGRLARELSPYLGLEPADSPDLVPWFWPPSFRRVYLGDPADARTYVLNMSVRRENGIPFNPWGTLAGDGGTPAPISLLPPGAWAMSDADRQHPRVRNAPWSVQTPEEPIHGRQRMGLTFGGSVVFLPEEELE